MELAVEETPIPGLLVLRLPVHGDRRGWFKENWQRAKATALGLPDFGPVQHNVAYNATRGTTRGFHAEPWDKYVSVAAGRVFGAWVDLRAESFGATYTVGIGPDTAVFVPRGVANAYQALDEHTVYSYLVNDHWTPGERYPAVDLGDPRLAVAWPIPLEQAEVSEKDRANPALAEVAPMPPRRTLVIGGGGQLGRALAAGLSDVEEVDVVERDEFDLGDPKVVDAWPWHEYGTVINAAAYTAVDLAETPEGRSEAWRTNAAGVARLARAATEHRLTLVHYSTEYVFDGTVPVHVEDEAYSPTSVYGQSKAAGELAACSVPRHYVLRTSWLVGEGHNFVRTMAGLAERGVSPSVVTDQIGRLTFTSTLVEATRHLLGSGAAYGIYQVSNAGEPLSWHQVAARVFEACGRSAADVTETTTEAYAAGVRAAGRPYAPRPASSILALDKLHAAVFDPEDQLTALARYLGDL